MDTTSHQDMEYFLEPIIFCVEGSLFRLPREYLVQASALFLDMLQLPQPATSPSLDSGSEGSADNVPIVLPGVTVSAFRSLLRLLYSNPSDIPGGLNFTQDEWLGALSLTDLWDLPEVRTKAVDGLRPLLVEDPTYQLVLAKKYHIDDWVRPALESLIRRSPPLGNREFEMLDQEILLKIAALRERCYPVFRDSDNRYGASYQEDTTIGHWDVLQERGDVSINLDHVNFTVSPSPDFRTVSEGATSQGEGDQRDGEFYFEKIVFKVEGRLFKIPNHPFAQHSQIFRREFEQRGFLKYDHHDPFIVEGVTANDFRHLLQFFFPPQKLIVDREPTSEEWISILRLAAKWEMTQVKDLAVSKLEEVDFGSINSKLRIAKELGVQEWFSAGMKSLITQSSPLTAPDCQVLGDRELILQVLDLRERAHHRIYLYTYGHSPRNHLRSERGEVPADLDVSTQVASLL